MCRLAVIYCICVAIIGLASAGFDEIPASLGGEADGGRQGRLDGTWLWTLHDTANGLRPTQSWHATAS